MGLQLEAHVLLDRLERAVVFVTSSVPMQLVGISAGMNTGTQLLLLTAPASENVS